MVQPTHSSNSSTCLIASIYPIQPPLSTSASAANPHYDNAGRPGSNLLPPNVFICEFGDFSQVLARDGRDLLIRVYCSPRSTCSGLLAEVQGLHYHAGLRYEEIRLCKL